MRFSRLLFFFAFALSTLTLGAQDTHFPLHNYAPLWVNPANTGAFSGSIRAGGVHRGQWFGLNGIQTSNLYADAPLAFGFRKQDWVGVGFNFITDDAGEFDITSTFFGFSGAYHLSLDKKRTNILTLGVQYVVDSTIMQPMVPREFGPESRRRQRTIHAHARLDMEMSEKWRFQPTVFFQSSAGASSVSLQTWGARQLKKNLDLRLGLGYRTGDAAKVMVGFDTDRLRTALAYDITLSQARAVTGFQGAFELGLA